MNLINIYKEARRAGYSIANSIRIAWRNREAQSLFKVIDL